MKIYAYIAVMALVTYLIRALPITLVRREIKSPFVKSFLYYVPYACLAAMTFPAILGSTASLVSAAAGFLAAVAAAYFDQGLLKVAMIACAAVFVTERLLAFF